MTIYFVNLMYITLTRTADASYVPVVTTLESGRTHDLQWGTGTTLL